MWLLLACTSGKDSGGGETGAPDATRDLGDAFAADTLEGYVTYLASEELAGREAGSEGDLLGVAYIEAAFDAAGFEPLDGGWEQPFVDSAGTDSINVLGVRWEIGRAHV